MLPKPRDGYPLTRDDAEHQRLAQQAAFWAPDASALFDAAGIGAGQRVADLGCGTPEVARRLAECVGPQGRVQALDSDAALMRAQARLASTPGWLQFECGDAYATRWPDASLDAAHARFLAAPAGRLDALIAEMLRLVRPGGIVMLQEPDACTWSLPAAGAAWQRFVALVRAAFAHRGGDFDAGLSAAQRLRAAGATQLRTRRVVHELPARHPYARLPLSFCDSLRGSWLSAGLSTAGEIDDLRLALAAALDSAAAATTFTLVQVWARVDVARRP